jgi:hypothetical protein
MRGAIKYRSRRPRARPGTPRPELAQFEAARARLRARLIADEQRRAAGFVDRHQPDIGRGIGYLILGLAIALIIAGVLAS